MNFRPAKCPNCGGALQLPDDRDTVNCMYCGGTIVVREAIQAAAAATVPNLLKLARSAAQSHNHQEAYDYYTRVLEVDGDNAEAWRGKAEACGCLSGPNSFRLPEMVEYYRNAIEATEGKKKEAARDEAANSISRVSLQYYRNARNGLSPAFAENASWELYLQTLGDVLKVLDQTLKVMPDNVMLLRTTMKICKDNPSKLSYINRRTGTRNWRYLSPEWQRAIESKLGYCSGELQRLDPTLASPEAEPSKSLLDSIMASPRLVPTIAFGLLLFVLVGLLLSAAKVADRSPSVIATASSPTPELNCAAYEQFTYKSTYDEIIRVLGPPDSESSKGPPDAVIPNIFMHYRRCGYTIISIYGKNPKNGVFDKSTTRYVGTKSVNPPRTMHVSQERFRVLVDALQ